MATRPAHRADTPDDSPALDAEARFALALAEHLHTEHHYWPSQADMALALEALKIARTVFVVVDPFAD